MAIKRIDLVSAINTAYKKLDYDTYTELLRLYYKLLEQEDINDDFITEFITYELLSDSALNLISNY